MIIVNNEDSRGALDSFLYSWIERNHEIIISWNNQIVTILRKEQAMKFLDKITLVLPKEAQLIMAKATGNFKRGNERNPSRN